MEGERDPRPLLVIFETLKFVQKTFDAQDVEVYMPGTLSVSVLLCPGGVHVRAVC